MSTPSSKKPTPEQLPAEPEKGRNPDLDPDLDPNVDPNVNPDLSREDGPHPDNTLPEDPNTYPDPANPQRNP